MCRLNCIYAPLNGDRFAPEPNPINPTKTCEYRSAPHNIEPNTQIYAVRCFEAKPKRLDPIATPTRDHPHTCPLPPSRCSSHMPVSKRPLKIQIVCIVSHMTLKSWTPIHIEAQFDIAVSCRFFGSGCISMQTATCNSWRFAPTRRISDPFRWELFAFSKRDPRFLG